MSMLIILICISIYRNGATRRPLVTAGLGKPPALAGAVGAEGRADLLRRCSVAEVGELQRQLEPALATSAITA